MPSKYPVQTSLSYQSTPMVSHWGAALSLSPLVVLLWFLTGCTTTAGNTADASQMASIRTGETTEAEVVGMFGPPSGRGLDSEGRRMLTWDYLHVRSNPKAFVPVAGMFLNSGDVTQQMLKISFDGKGVVATSNLHEETRQTNIFDSNR